MTFISNQLWLIVVLHQCTVVDMITARYLSYVVEVADISCGFRSNRASSTDESQLHWLFPHHLVEEGIQRYCVATLYVRVIEICMMFIEEQAMDVVIGFTLRYVHISVVYLCPAGACMVSGHCDIVVCLAHGYGTRLQIDANIQNASDMCLQRTSEGFF